jgi:branched-subunit amino acid aminotransferase/4-amino-4-deoxychorismate lyase
VLVTQHALEPGPEPAPAVVRAVTVGWSRALAGVKHTSWLAASEALRHARTAGADTALLTRPDPAGHAADDLVLEGATANLLLVDTAGAVVTPPADGSLLPGITRATVLDLTRASGLVVEERHVRRAEVSRAAEALLTSSLRGVTALTHVDGVAVGDGTAGEVTTRLAALWEAEATRRTAGGG